MDRPVTHLHHRIVRIFRGPKLFKAFDRLGQERRTRDHLGWFRAARLLLRTNVADQAR